MVTYVKQHGRMDPSEPLLRTHTGRDSRSLFHGWLVALAILFGLSTLVVPTKLIVGAVVISFLVTLGTASGVYLVLLQRSTKSNACQGSKGEDSSTPSAQTAPAK